MIHAFHRQWVPFGCHLAANLGTSVRRGRSTDPATARYLASPHVAERPRNRYRQPSCGRSTGVMPGSFGTCGRNGVPHEALATGALMSDRIAISKTVRFEEPTDG